jgi:hypothetical protein
VNHRLWLLVAALSLPGCSCEREPEPKPTQETRADAAREPTAPPPGPDRIAAAGRVIAIGDVHGDLAAARRALRLAAVIDEEDDWTGEKTIVVQTGDQLDRGDDEPEVMALFDALADEAKQKGGAVISLNGNHEVMNVQGDFRYVTDDAFRDFASYATGAADPSKGRSKAFLPGGPVALKLADRPITAIVGDTLFVHGAVLPTHVRYGLKRINEQARAWMRGEIQRIPPELNGDDTLIWSRAYGDEIVNPRACEALGQVLAALAVKRLVVGHTVQKNGISAGCEERVWRIDVGLAKHYGGKPAVLEIQGDRVRAITEGDG